MTGMNRAATGEGRRRYGPWANIVLYGLCGGALITLLKFTEYRFLVVEHSLEIYGGLVAAIFSALGIWLGRTLTRKKTAVRPAPPGGGLFQPDQQRIAQLSITPRELEILGLIAAGLSNREIAERLFVSETTIKTQAMSVYRKLGVASRSEAVDRASQLGYFSLDPILRAHPTIARR